MWNNLIQIFFRFMFDKNLMYLLPPILFNLSLTASIVIVAVLLVRQLLRKAPRVYSYVLWAVVAFRLICPVSFSSEFSLLNIVNAPDAESGLVSGMVEYVPIDIVHNPNPSVDLIIPEVTETVNDQLPSPESQIYGEFLEAPAELASWIWMLGAGAMLLWALNSYFNLRHKLRTAVLLEGNVFQSEHVGSPFILGLFRPKIYIPFGLDENTLRYVLAHERYHLKRLDHIVKVFAFLILTVHWFNPLCWLAFYLMSKDMEMSCDEKVLAQDDNKKTEYSTVLLSFAANRRFPSPSPLAFGETGAKSRIKNALKWKRPKVWVTVLAAVVCIAILVACAANPKEETSIPEDSPYEWTSTAQTDDLLSVSIRPLDTGVNYSVNLSDERCEELFDILNGIPSDAIYAGRGSPSLLSVTIVQQSQTVYLNYGGDLVEISLLGASTDQIWEIHDGALNELMADYLEMAQGVYEKYALDSETATGIEVTTPTVAWEYNPYLSSVYPAFPFDFTGFPHSRIEATCSAGRLVNRVTGEEGSSMTYHDALKQTLYWTPHTPDSLNVPSATIQFTAYDGDEAVFSGSILIEQMEGDSFSSIYSARLSAGSELILRKNSGGVGGGLIYRIPVHDLTESGPIELGGQLLRFYHFKTNSEKIYLDFERSDEPIEIRLYATDAEEPLMSFSTASKNLASCCFSNLTSVREYYFAVQCAPNTLFTIHD